MSNYKLPERLKSPVAPRDAWTTLILGHLSEEEGKIRLDYGTGRQSTTGPRSALYLTVRPQQIDEGDGQTVIFHVEGEGQQRQSLKADELSRRLYQVTIEIFQNYRIKRRRRSGEGSNRPRKMWFNLVICNRSGEALDEDSFEHSRGPDDRIVGHPRSDDEEEDEISTTGDYSQDPEQKFTRVLMRERAEMFSNVMACADKSAEQARLAMDQARTIGDVCMDTTVRMETFMTNAMNVHAQAIAQQAAADVAKIEIEKREIMALAEMHKKSFWETPVGEQLGNTINMAAERVLQVDSERASDWFGRVVAKGLHYFEQIKSKAPPRQT